MHIYANILNEKVEKKICKRSHNTKGVEHSFLLTIKPE